MPMLIAVEFWDNLNKIQTVINVVALWLLLGLKGAFKTGIWFKGTDHTEQLNGIGNQLRSIDEWQDAANERMSKLTSNIQSMEDRVRRDVRADLRDYVLKDVFDPQMQESKEDRVRLWAAVSGIASRQAERRR